MNEYAELVYFGVCSFAIHHCSHQMDTFSARGCQNRNPIFIHCHTLKPNQICLLCRLVHTSHTIPLFPTLLYCAKLSKISLKY